MNEATRRELALFRPGMSSDEFDRLFANSGQNACHFRTEGFPLLAAYVDAYMVAAGLEPVDCASSAHALSTAAPSGAPTWLPWVVGGGLVLAVLGAIAYGSRR